VSEPTTPAHTVPTAGARALCRTLRLIRTESADLAAAGALAVSADDLIGHGSHVTAWLEELLAAAVTAAGDEVALPRRETWELQHIAYTISAVLVWAACLHDDGRLRAGVDDAALLTWDAVEGLAGMAGRTTGVLGVPAPPPAPEPDAGTPTSTIPAAPTARPPARTALPAPVALPSGAGVGGA
jgi:hypothetical protein